MSRHYQNISNKTVVRIAYFFFCTSTCWSTPAPNALDFGLARRQIVAEAEFLGKPLRASTSDAGVALLEGGRALLQGRLTLLRALIELLLPQNQVGSQEVLLDDLHLLESVVLLLHLVEGRPHVRQHRHLCKIDPPVR